jgi:hypothetical protein
LHTLISVSVSLAWSISLPPPSSSSSSSSFPNYRHLDANRKNSSLSGRIVDSGRPKSNAILLLPTMSIRNHFLPRGLVRSLFFSLFLSLSLSLRYIRLIFRSYLTECSKPLATTATGRSRSLLLRSSSNEGERNQGRGSLSLSLSLNSHFSLFEMGEKRVSA